LSSICGTTRCRPRWRASNDYDDKLPDDSPNGIRDRVVWLRDFEQRLVASVPWKELPIEQRIDFGFLRSASRRHAGGSRRDQDARAQPRDLSRRPH
jgi:hypothetical protein